MSPSQYLAPWSFDPLEPEQAKRLLLDELGARGGTVIREDMDRGYIAVLVPYELAPGRVQPLTPGNIAQGGGVTHAKGYLAACDNEHSPTKGCPRVPLLMFPAPFDTLYMHHDNKNVFCGDEW
ncbi:hypothetical protein Vafri_17917 [Volvox africanus]|uniref:Uncharacterized protein n=1 Tax=Volvox africanus TaxID=51714 RepID=A0A8J4BLZ0_9CHLO|nr:hypothetical protein Vafri_17917 [Volvox africanus]